MIETASLRRKLLDLAITGNLVPRTGEWKSVKLGDAAYVTKLAGFEYSKYIAPALAKSGVPLFKGKNIRDGVIIWEFEDYIPESVSQSLERSRIDTKCLLLPYVGTIGNVAIFDGSTVAHLGSNVAKIVVAQESGLSEEFLMHFIRSGLGHKQLDKNKKATAQESVSMAALRELEVPLPPLAEQKAIVKRLGEFLALEREIAVDSTAVDDLVVAAKRKVLDLAVSGKLITQKPSYGDARDVLKFAKCTKKAIKVASINPISPPYEIPKSWVWCRAGELGLMIRGSGIKRSETVEIGLPCVRYGEIYTSYTYRFTKAKSFVSSDMFSSCKLINCGDLAFTLTGENKPDIAKTIAYEGTEPVAAGGDLAVWSKHCSDPIYLSYFMSSTVARKQVSKLATGDIVCHISTDKLASIWLPLPPLAEQKAIVAKVDELFSVLDAMKGSQK